MASSYEKYILPLVQRATTQPLPASADPDADAWAALMDETFRDTLAKNPETRRMLMQLLQPGARNRLGRRPGK